VFLTGRANKGQPTLSVLINTNDFALGISPLDNLIVGFALVLEHAALVLQAANLLLDIVLRAVLVVAADQHATFGKEGSGWTVHLVGALDLDVFLVVCVVVVVLRWGID
jgi:hypothetical protein